MSAFEEGREAYHRDGFDAINPYDETDAQWEEWEDGFDDAFIGD